MIATRGFCLIFFYFFFGGKDCNCDLGFLQETKLEDVELSDICSLWRNQHVGLLFLR